VGKVKVPALYIWGDQDMALGKTAATRTAGYVVEVLEGYFHWLLEEAPDKISELILNHLKTFG
jgi:pimeloyl-ACP methyl ester carboxylesterase